MKNIFLLSIVGNLNRKREELIYACLAEMSKASILEIYCGSVHFQQWLFLRVLIIWFRKLNKKNTPFLNKSFQHWLLLRVLIIWFRKLNKKNTPFLNKSLMSKHKLYSHKCKNCLKKTVSSGNVQSCNNDVPGVIYSTICDVAVLINVFSDFFLIFFTFFCKIVV